MCVFERPGATLPGVSKASKPYTGRAIYENNEAKTIGTIVATTALNTVN